MIHYTLFGQVFPKARPKINYRTKRTYKCPKYRAWQDKNIETIQSQGVPEKPLEGASVSIVFSGKHNRSKDLDNMAGAVLDVLVACGVLRDDNSICVSRLDIRMNHSNESPTTDVVIQT